MNDSSYLRFRALHPESDGVPQNDNNTHSRNEKQYPNDAVGLLLGEQSKTKSGNEEPQSPKIMKKSTAFTVNAHTVEQHS